MIVILKKWHEISFELVDNKKNYPSIPIPLYIEAIEKMEELDSVKHVESHFKDKRYFSVNELYKSLKLIQKSHNDDVGKSIRTLEERIIGLISQNAEFKNQDDKEAFLKKLFQYYLRVSKGSDIHLISKLFEAESGWIYRDIVPSDNQDELIVTGLNTEHQRIDETRNLLDRNQGIDKKLRDYDEVITQFKSNFYKFQLEINRIIHEAEILGIHGDCQIEDQLRLRRKFIKKLKSVFSLKRS